MVSKWYALVPGRYVRNTPRIATARKSLRSRGLCGGPNLAGKLLSRKKEVLMPPSNAKKIRKPAKKVKSLPAKVVSSKHARGVKGGDVSHAEFNFTHQVDKPSNK